MLMSDDPNELLQKYITENPSVCSRCFEESMTKRAQGSGIAGGTPCGKKCGSMGLSMESEPQPYSTLRHRTDNLLDILESNDIDLNSDLIHKAVEKHATLEPPREVFKIALAYGLGQRNESRLHPQESQDEEQHSEPTQDLITHLKNGPVTTLTLDRCDSSPDVKEQLTKFRVPLGANDVQYLEQPEKFATEHNIDEIASHAPYDVVKTGLSSNWENFERASSNPVREWMDELDDEFSQHVLPAALSVRTYTPIDPWDDSFRDTSFWPLVKRRKAQPILAYMQKQQKSAHSSAEIAEGINESEDVVRRALKILRENETVKSRGRSYSEEDRGWVYVED